MNTSSKHSLGLPKRFVEKKSRYPAGISNWTPTALHWSGISAANSFISSDSLGSVGRSRKLLYQNSRPSSAYIHSKTVTIHKVYSNIPCMVTKHICTCIMWARKIDSLCCTAWWYDIVVVKMGLVWWRTAMFHQMFLIMVNCYRQCVIRCSSSIWEWYPGLSNTA